MSDALFDSLAGFAFSTVTALNLRAPAARRPLLPSKNASAP